MRKPTAMTISEYRDLIDHVWKMACDLHRCVNDQEKLAWAKRAEKLRLESWSVQGLVSRATERDEKKMVRAKAELEDAYSRVFHLIVGEQTFGIGEAKINEVGHLSWKFDGQGQWNAVSLARGEDNCEYRIGVCDDGTFDVSESDSELMGGTKKIDCFPSLQSAKDWCQANEAVLAFSVACD